MTWLARVLVCALWVSSCALLMSSCGGDEPLRTPRPPAPASSGDEWSDEEEPEGDEPIGDAPPASEEASFDREPVARTGCTQDCPIDTELWLEQHGIEEPMPVPANVPTDSSAYDGGCRPIAMGPREGLRCRTSNAIGAGWELEYETLLASEGTFMRIVWTGPTAAAPPPRSGEQALPSARLAFTFEADGNTFTLADANCATARAAVDQLTEEQLQGAAPARVRRIFDQVCGAQGRYALSRGGYRRAAQ